MCDARVRSRFGLHPVARALIPAFGLAASFAAGAAPPKFAIGTAIPVNAQTADQQVFPAVARAADGRFVVVWYTRIEGDTEIHAQRFAPGGRPLGTEFKVNDFNDGGQKDPGVAMEDDGDFVVTWQSYSSSNYGIAARRYRANGRPKAGEFNVARHGAYTSVGVDRVGGSFVVAWQANGHVLARQFGPTGKKPLGKAFKVDQNPAAVASAASIAVENGGDFIVAWDSSVNGEFDIFAHRYTAAGAEKEVPFRVNGKKAGGQVQASVGVDAAGNFTVAWDDFTDAAVRLRRFDSSAAPLGGDVTVSTNGGDPRIAVDPTGGQMVVWSWNHDDTVYDILGRAYLPDGSPRGKTFDVDSDEPGSNVTPAVAIDADGDAVAVWTLQVDGGFGDIRAQLYRRPRTVTRDAGD